MFTVLIATVVVLVGLLIGIAVAQLRGLRMGGVIVVPLVAVYALWNFRSLPVFLLSFLAAYLSLWYTKPRLPLYGRQLFVLAVVTGALVPVATFELLTLGFGGSPVVTGVAFVGSVLPGIAAFNFHRLDPADRVLDGVATLVTLVVLVGGGVVSTVVVGATPLAGVLPPLLLGPQSDVALVLGVTVDRASLPVIASSRLSLGLIVFSMTIAELCRARYGLRLAGTIVVPLVVLIAFRNAWLLPVWLVVSATTYVGVQLLHRWTLLYGRVLLAFGVILGVLGTIVAVGFVPTRHGLLPFFIGLFAGATAYNLHVVPPAERRATVVVTVGVLSLTVFGTRLFVVPGPGGLLRSVTELWLLVGLAAVLPAAWELYQLESNRPREVHDYVGRLGEET